MQSFLYNLDNVHLFAWIAIMWIIAHCIETQREELLSEKPVWRTTPFFALMIFLPIILMAVWGRPRSDTYLYLSIYRRLPTDFAAGFREAVSAKEPGFALFQFIISQLTGKSETAFRLAIALVHVVPVITVLRRYSDDYLFSVYLFIAGGYHLAWMMNGIRQFMAATIIFAATPWIVQRKYIRSVLLVLLASTFHRSAMFMLPVVFIVQGEAWNWKTLAVSVVAMAAAFVFARDTRLFDEFADSVGYSMEAVHEWGDDGAHPLRLLVAAVPMGLSFLARDKIREEGSGILNLCANMSVITTGVTLIAVVTSGIMVGRMPVYTSLYNLILLPFVIHEAFESQNATFVKILAVAFYFLYFYVQMGL